MSHGATGSEIGVADAFGSEALHERAYDAVATGVPSCTDDADGTMLFCCLIERTAQRYNLCVDVEGIDGVDAEGETLQGVLFDFASGSGEDGNVHLREFADVANDGIACQFGRTVFCTVATDDAAALHVGSSLNGFQGIASDVAVANNGCTDFLFHKSL